MKFTTLKIAMVWLVMHVSELILFNSFICFYSDIHSKAPAKHPHAGRVTGSEPLFMAGVQKRTTNRMLEMEIKT